MEVIFSRHCITRTNSFKIFSNFVHFYSNFQIVCPFLLFFFPFFDLFLKNRMHALTFIIGPDYGYGMKDSKISLIQVDTTYHQQLLLEIRFQI